MASSKHRRLRRRLLTTMIIILTVGTYAGLCLLLPVKALSPPQSNSFLKITTPTSNLPWPKYGEGAVGLGNGTVIQSHGQQAQLPIASVAKLITALTVLKKYPLVPGQNGPMITIDSTDYGFYSKYIAEQGSVVPVYVGEQLSELQMLEAMLVPSGNNIADSLARWAYGSVSGYDQFANNYIKQLGLVNTTVAGDASGYLPTTISNSDDLIKLGGYVMANPVLTQIVNLKSVNIPNVGLMQNYNNILGTAGIVGIKTGNSNQAGGVFLGAANTTVSNKTVMVLVALMGAPTLGQVLNDTVPVIISVENDFAQTILVNKGEILGEFKQPWGGIVQVAAKNNLIVYLLQGQTAKAKLHLGALTVPAVSGSVIGSLNSLPDQINSSVSDQVVIVQSTTKPSWQWRLLHPEYIL